MKKTGFDKYLNKKLKNKKFKKTYQREIKKLRKSKSYYIYVQEKSGYHAYGLLVESDTTISKNKAVQLLKKDMMDKIKKHDITVIDLGEE